MSRCKADLSRKRILVSVWGLSKWTPLWLHNFLTLNNKTERIKIGFKYILQEKISPLDLLKIMRNTTSQINIKTESHLSMNQNESLVSKFLKGMREYGHRVSLFFRVCLVNCGDRALTPEQVTWLWLRVNTHVSATLADKLLSLL